MSVIDEAGARPSDEFVECICVGRLHEDYFFFPLVRSIQIKASDYVTLPSHFVKIFHNFGFGISLELLFSTLH
jgi:hypothetical protein